ncbi:MAG: hypothetical protein ACRYGI_17495 [Janthinobacterium lividum]
MTSPGNETVRDDLLNRYRMLRAINMEHQNAVVGMLSKPVILGHMRRLGLARGSHLLVEQDEVLTLGFDLAVYTASNGRSSGLDRYVRTPAFAAGSDEALVLDAMTRARFSIWQVERLHEQTGLIVHDVLRETEAWLIDEHLQASIEPGMSFAARLFEPEPFCMTCGVVVPVDTELLAEVSKDELAWRRGDGFSVGADPRFATAIYRTAIEHGFMDDVSFL